MDLLRIASAAARAAHLAGALSLLGTLGFLTWMLPVVLPAADGVTHRLRRRLLQLSVASALVAVLAGLVWLALETAAIAGVSSLPGVARALPLVIAHTRFGPFVLARLGILLGATIVMMAGNAGLCAALSLTVVALAPEGFISHAGAMGGTMGLWLMIAEAIHILAAAFWIGGLMPLWLSIRMLPPDRAARLCQRFSPVGTTCVLALAGSALAQGVVLVGSLSGLLASLYGRLVMVKAALFLLALGLAAINRWWLTPRLAVSSSATPAQHDFAQPRPADHSRIQRSLARSVAVEALLGLAIIVAAAFLASAMPVMPEMPGMTGRMACASSWRLHTASGAMASRPRTPALPAGGWRRDVGIRWRSG